MDECYKSTTPDTVWNNATNNKNNRLQKLAEKMEDLSRTLRSFTVAKEVLEKYKSSLDDQRQLLFSLNDN